MLSMLIRAASALLLIPPAYSSALPAQDDTSTSVQGLETALPIVDLGYSRYRPVAENITGQYYNFSNIRYAAPPLGPLRWSAPTEPLTDPNNTIHDGSLGYICPQAPPLWFEQADTALGDLVKVIPPAISGQRESEDCLFLDVIVPVEVFKKWRQSHKRAPVLLNIHGGGFWIGEKGALYPPNGMLKAADSPIIYISINYRLAAFGFLSHLAPSSSNRTAANAGLLDQRFALKWVQRYVHLFGGDANRVTITGQSAGGASVQYQTVAYGGTKEANLFIQGIAQSPAPLASDPIYAPLGANLFFKSLGVSSVDEARGLDSTILQKANKDVQSTTPFNAVYFGPTIDGDFLTDILPRLYNNGMYVKNVTLITSNNEHEARFLGNQSIKTDADFENWVYTNFPSASTAIQNQIIHQIYPSNSNGSLPLPYRTPQERNNLATKEYLISCNTVSIAEAYGNKTHNYIFGIPPAIHSQDLAYTYYPNTPTPGFYPEVAGTLQGYLTNFVISGDPNGPGLPKWPEYGQQAAAVNFTIDGVKNSTSDAANSRCAFWNRADYYPEVSSG